MATAPRTPLSRESGVRWPASRWRLASRISHVRQRLLGGDLLSRSLQFAGRTGEDHGRESALETGHSFGHRTVKMRFHFYVAQVIAAALAIAVISEASAPVAVA